MESRDPVRMQQFSPIDSEMVFIKEKKSSGTPQTRFFEDLCNSNSQVKEPYA